MADWNRDFKGVTFYGGRDTLWTDAAVIEASQNTKIDCNVISRPYAQTFTVIVDAVEGEPAALPLPRIVLMRVVMSANMGDANGDGEITIAVNREPIKKT